MDTTDKIKNHHACKFTVNGAGKYLEVHPNTQDYNRFLREALLCNDIDTLQRVKGNSEKPVHIIDADHYAAYLAAIDGQSLNVIVVTRSLFRSWNKLEDGRTFDWQGIERPIPYKQGGWFEIANYKTYEQVTKRVFKH